MSADLCDALQELIQESLAQWGCGEVSEVSRGTDGVLMLTSGQHVITVERAPEGLPFRWIVHVDQRRRAAASIVGVLRMIRQTLSIDYAPGHVTVAQLPPAPR